MRTRKPALVSALFIVLITATGQAQQLKISTKSAEARSAFYSGIDAVENLLPHQAELHLARALALEPALGIARAYLAAFAQSLTAEQRRQELQRAAADAMDASVGELLVVLALRAPAGEERRALLQAAVDAVPDDPHVLYQFAVNTADMTDRIRQLESLTRRFPTFAPAYNLLAYAKAREQDDRAAGLAFTQRYLELTPDNPNAHDSHAEMLQWSGRLGEASQHYLMASTLDPSFSAAHSGLAEIALLQGDAAKARQHYHEAMRRSVGAQQRLGIRQSIAATYIVEGKVKSALTSLQSIASEAETQGMRAVAAQAYRHMAVIEAALGTKTNVHPLIAKADSLSTANNILQRGFAAAAYALAGDLAAARPLAASVIAIANGANSAQLKRQAVALNEIVQYSSGQTEAARGLVMSSGSYGAMGRLLLAEAYARQGRRNEARAIAGEVKGYYQTDLFTLIARTRARKLSN
jgi:hypothetical protein